MLVVPSRTRRAAVGVGVLFASNGAIYSGLLPWYPLLARRLDLSASQLGLIVASFATGAIASSALPARLIAWWGPVRVSLVSTIVLALAVAAVPWTPAGWVFAAALFLAGFSDAVADVAQNLAGVRVQDAARRSILSSMHAVWSLGGVATGAASTASAALGVDMRIHMAVVSSLGIALVALGGRWIGSLADNPRVPDVAATGPAPAPVRSARGRWGMAAKAALPLVVVAICGTMVEDVANNWAALSGERLAGLSAGAAGAAFTVMIGFQCLGRFTGDPLISQFGPGRIARIGGTLVALGGVAIVAASGPVLLFAGFAVAGYGTATLVPSAFSAAAHLRGVGQGDGVTIISWLMRIGFLATSPIVGAVADGVSLRWGLAILILVGATAAAVAGALGRSQERKERV